MPHVAPYSGAMLAMVARSARALRQAGAEELDELSDDALLAKHLRDREDEVRRRRARGELAGELEPDDLRDQHRHRLAEHRGFGLDAADAPPEHAQAVDHRGVAVGAHERVWISDALGVHKHAPGEVFEVHLMANAGAGWDHLEVAEGASGPSAGMCTAPGFARTRSFDVVVKGLRCAVLIDLHGVVDDQLDRHRAD